MLKSGSFIAASALFAVLASAGVAQAAAAAAQPARKVPGINAADAFPRGCVDCHVAGPPGTALDARLSTQLKSWSSGKVDAALLATAQAAAPAGLKLKGKHPDAEDALEDAPNGCLDCHSGDSKKAPPFASMMHRIHLVGGEQNRFMTVYQGECTHCHKLDAARGAWSMPSGPEKK